jgi:hypothetical protein
LPQSRGTQFTCFTGIKAPMLTRASTPPCRNQEEKEGEEEEGEGEERRRRRRRRRRGGLDVRFTGRPRCP